VRILVVTGTDTGVGKTVVSAGLAAIAREQGQRVAVVKPVQTGLGPGDAGDLADIRRLSGVTDLHEFARFGDPLAPATAARRANVNVPTVQELAAAVLGLSDRDLVLIEGAGGLLVHLDADGGTLADLASCLGARAIVVAHAGLGTLNATALTCEALDARGVECLGVVVGAWPAEPDLAARCNIDDLPRYTGRPLLGRVPDGAGRLPRYAFLEAVRSELTPALVAASAPFPNQPEVIA
jgi:dethiobiotin synthetase